MPVRAGLQIIGKGNESLEEQVCAYESDGTAPGQIVFYGPSYFTRWSEKWGMTPLREVIRGKSGAYCAVNRGFGSSCAENQLYYYPRMIRPIAPKVLVYECFGNSTLYGYSLSETWELAQRVLAYAQTDFPEMRIYLCGTHPKREALTEEARQERELFNFWLRKYADRNENCRFIDVMNYEPLQRKDIFIRDGIHFNQLGYDVYAELFRKELAEELANY